MITYRSLTVKLQTYKRKPLQNALQVVLKAFELHACIYTELFSRINHLCSLQPPPTPQISQPAWISLLAIGFMESEINYNVTIVHKRYDFRTKAVNKVIRSWSQPSLSTILKTYGVLITAADLIVL